MTLGATIRRPLAHQPASSCNSQGTLHGRQIRTHAAGDRVTSTPYMNQSAAKQRGREIRHTVPGPPSCSSPTVSASPSSSRPRFLPTSCSSSSPSPSPSPSTPYETQHSQDSRVVIQGFVGNATPRAPRIWNLPRRGDQDCNPTFPEQFQIDSMRVLFIDFLNTRGRSWIKLQVLDYYWCLTSHPYQKHVSSPRERPPPCQNTPSRFCTHVPSDAARLSRSLLFRRLEPDVHRELCSSLKGKTGRTVEQGPTFLRYDSDFSRTRVSHQNSGDSPPKSKSKSK